MIDQLHRFTMPVVPIKQEPQRQVMTQSRRITHRRHIPLIVHPNRVRTVHRQMRPSGQFPLRINRFQPDKLFTFTAHHVWPLGRRIPDTVFLLADHTAKPDVRRIHPPMNFRVRDEPFFNAQHVEGFHPVNAAAHGLSLRAQLAKQRCTISRRHRNFIRMFARK